MKQHRAASTTDYESWREDDVTPTLNQMDNTSEAFATVLTFAWQNGGGYGNANDGLAITVDGASPMTKSQVQAVADGYTVRRLTPRECERLQGWPDDHTRWGVDDAGREYEMSNSQRYRQVGNGVTSPVAAYIGSLILHAEQEMNDA